MADQLTRQQLRQQFFEKMMDSPHRNITKRISVEVFPAYRVIRLEGRNSERLHDFEIALINTYSREIAYYVDVAYVDADFGGKPPIHALAYRSTDAAHKVALDGFAASVLFDCLVPDHTVILTDGNPTDGGPFLWESRISLAINYGRKAYFIQPDGVLRRLSSRDDHIALNDEIWSTPNAGKINLAAISGKELTAIADHDFLLNHLKPRMATQVTDLVSKV